MGRQGRDETLVLVQARVPKRVRELLQKLAADDRRSMSGFVAVVLERYAEEAGRAGHR